MASMKICTSCTQSKPATRQYFHYNNATRDGYQYRCIDCVAYYMKHDYIPSNEKPRLTQEYYDNDTAKHETCELKLQIEKAARDAKYAATGIIIDGIKIDTPIKVCNECFVQYPATTDYFHSRKQNKDGFNGCCKVCMNKNKK